MSGHLKHSQFRSAPLICVGISHADIFEFVLTTVATAYTTGPHFSRPWNNAAYGNNQEGTLTNARSIRCSIIHRSSFGCRSGSVIPDCISLGAKRPFRERATQASSYYCEISLWYVETLPCHITRRKQLSRLSLSLFRSGSSGLAATESNRL